MSLNIEHLIALVEERPVIWDKACEEYKFRNLKSAAWDEICSVLIENFKDLPPREKSEKGKSLIKTWCNEREKWLKWRKRLKDSQKTGVGTVKKNRLSDQLLFLDKIITPSEDNADSLIQEVYFTEKQEFTSDSSQDQQSNHSQRSDQSQRYIRQARKRPVDQFEGEMIKALKLTPTASAASNESHKEPHTMSFFRGILPFLDDFDIEEILEFQIRVLNLIKQMKQEKKRRQ